MNCQLAQEPIVAAAYGELPDEQMRALEQHLASCPACRREQEQLQALKALADADPVWEPDANLIARSRLKLEEALDALPPLRWYERLGQGLQSNIASLTAIPVAACLLLVIGAGAGLWGGYQMAANRPARGAAVSTALVASIPIKATAATAKTAPAAAAVPASSEIANISSVVQQPNSRRVEVRYNQVVPQRVEGSLDDPAIRHLLMLASQNPVSARLRSDSVSLLAAECRARHGCQAAGIRNALLTALRFDRNAGVRQKALQGLEPYVAEDMRVRDAVLTTLMDDVDPRIRNAALNILGPVEADTSVRQVLHSVANTDRNPYIRTVSRQFLDNVPEIQ
jgi:anti-sigma factor RsiW